jgi:hypothetical protein
MDEWAYETCRKCSGTGWYRLPWQEVFIVFCFAINGETYSWHQPEDLVTWKYELTADSEPWQPEPQEKPVALRPGKFADAKALVRYVIEQLGK